MTPDVSDPSFYDLFITGCVLLVFLWFVNPAGVEAVFEIIFYLLAGTVLLIVCLFRWLQKAFGYVWPRYGPGLGRLMLLLGFIIIEAFRRTPPESEPEFEDPETEFEPDPEPGPRPKPKPVDKIGWALAVLGLTRDELTPETLKRAYRKAIKAAHPDLTGSTEEAVRINQARDAIRKHFNWN